MPGFRQLSDFKTPTQRCTISQVLYSILAERKKLLQLSSREDIGCWHDSDGRLSLRALVIPDFMSIGLRKPLGHVGRYMFTRKEKDKEVLASKWSRFLELAEKAGATAD